jgi:hypothetical protein
MRGNPEPYVRYRLRDCGDIVGQTGLAAVDAILAGERDPLVLAKLRHQRIKASEEVIAKSLGDYRRNICSRCGNRWRPIAATKS